MTRINQQVVNPINRSVHVESWLYVQDCCVCGVVFAVGKKFDQRRQEDKQTFYCPNGHGQSYKGPTAEQQAKAARKEAEKYKRMYQSADARASAAYDQAAAAERSRAAQKGANTKLRKRIGAGVCPCCNRTFQDLGRHMAGQHPNFHAET